MVTTDGSPLSQIELTVYNDEGFLGDAIGYGSVGDDGSFELINVSRTGRLELDPGQYRFTIESVGADILIPERYADPKKTILRVRCEPDAPIMLEVPSMSAGM
jgi:hypothetical protein